MCVSTYDVSGVPSGRSTTSPIGTRLPAGAWVLVSPGYQFGPSSGGHFRLCYARDEAEWALALDRMVGVLDGLARRRAPLAAV